MKNLHKILEKLQLNDEIIAMVNMKFDIPYIDDYNSVTDYWYPHPPCLIPLFLGYGASYKGVVKHFFFDKEITFVKYFLEWNYLLEFATNEKQIFSQMILDMDMVVEGLDDRIINFCEAIDFKKYQEVDDFANTYGNITEHYKKLVYLEENTPIIYCDTIDSYTGSYPSSESMINYKEVKDSCSFEIANKKLLSNIENLPEWLKSSSDKKQIFDKYIAENQLKEAWLTLNSNGWKLQNVVEGLEILKEKTDDKLFYLVADNWIEGFKNSNAKDSDLY